jgi:hypothetical protein
LVAIPQVTKALKIAENNACALTTAVAEYECTPASTGEGEKKMKDQKTVRQMADEQAVWYEIRGMHKDGYADAHRYTTKYAAQAIVDRMLACGYDGLEVMARTYGD